MGEVWSWKLSVGCAFIQLIGVLCFVSTILIEESIQFVHEG